MTVKYILTIAALAALFVAFPADKKSCAQTTSGGGIAPQTCDTQVWQTMEMRARMETEREIMQNQNLIFKPDSVLAYTCFDHFAEHAAQYGGVLFTHTTYWDGQEIIPWGSPNGMDHAIKTVVLDSMRNYMNGNFGATSTSGPAGETSSAGFSMLGDRGNDLGASAGLGAYQTSMTGKGTYNCNVMSAVWKAAKCMNFIHNNNFEDIDGFYPFANLQAHDGGEDIQGYETIDETRQYPAALACVSAFKVYQNTWVDAYRKSRNEDNFGSMNRFYDFSIPLVQTYQDVREKLEPAECGEPIPTGITVIETEGTYADGVCTNPGCVFVKSGDTGACEAIGNASGMTGNVIIDSLQNMQDRVNVTGEGGAGVEGNTYTGGR